MKFQRNCTFKGIEEIKINYKEINEHIVNLTCNPTRENINELNEIVTLSLKVMGYLPMSEKEEEELNNIACEINT